MQGLQADRAVVPCCIRQTTVALKGSGLYADTALVAVDMCRCSADAADPAFVAVELPLVLVVQQDTDRTPVPAHDDITLLTDLAGVLHKRTLGASHGNDGVPIHSMGPLHILFVLVLDLVVTESAIKELITTGGQKHRFPFVVSARHLFRDCDKSLD